MEGFIKFIFLNVSLIVISFFILILFLKFYLNINITSIGFLSFGFKYISKKINPIIEYINIKNINFSYSRVKYSKRKVLIINVRGIQIKLSPTFIDNVSKSEETSFLRKLNKNIIDGIYKYNLQKEIEKQSKRNKDTSKNINIPIIHLGKENTDEKINYINTNFNTNTNNNCNNSKLSNQKISINHSKNNLNIKNSNINLSQKNNDSYLKTENNNETKNNGDLSKSSKKNLNKLSTSTLYSIKSVKKDRLVKILIYMLDIKYIFENIIPSILSKLAINLIDIKIEVSFPEGSKIVYKQDYISFLTEKKILSVEKKFKYYDYIMFKNFEPYNSKTKFLFSEFCIKFLEVDHSFTSFSPLSEKINEGNNDFSNYDNSNFKYKEYDILRSDEKNSIIISSLLNCENAKITCNLSFQDVKWNFDGAINLLRLYIILKGIFENYIDINKKINEVKKVESKTNKQENIISKYKIIVFNNKNIKYIKNKVVRNNPLKSIKNKFNKLHNSIDKKYGSEFNNYHSYESLTNNVSNHDIFDNFNLNKFMNNEVVQIFLFYIKNTKVIFNFEILNFQIISTSYFCGTNMHSYTNNSNTSLNNEFIFNQDPQYLNVLTIGEIALKGEAFKSKSKLYNVITSITLKNTYFDIIDYNSRSIMQFLNIKSIFTKLEAIIQFFKYKQHLRYIKNINFDVEISKINVTSDFDYTVGLCQHIIFIMNNINNKHHYKYSDDPLYNINKLLMVSKSLSTENLMNSYIGNINSSNFSINDDMKPINKTTNSFKKKNNTVYNTIKILSNLNKKLSKLKIKFNFEIKDFIVNYIILSDKIHDYYYINDPELTLPNECILIQFGIKKIKAEYSNCNKIKFQNILSSSLNSLNSENKNSTNSFSTTDDNYKYVMYEEQTGLHEIQIEVYNINSTALFIDEENIVDNYIIKINKIYCEKTHNGIDLDKFSTKVIFNSFNFEKDMLYNKNEDKLLIGTNFGNLKFNFGTTKLASNILIILVDLLTNRIVQLSRLPLYKRTNSIFDNIVLLSRSSSEISSGLNECSDYEMNKSNIYFSTPELRNKENSLKVPKELGQSTSSIYTRNIASCMDGSYKNMKYGNNRKEESIFSNYMLLFDLKIRNISFSALNPDDECGFQFEIKKILFHYNNNCYVTSGGNSRKKNIIKPNSKIKNQFSFNINEIDAFYLDTIKYVKKGIVMHHFLKINDILINLVDVNSKSLSSLGEFSSLSSLSNIESIQSISRLQSSNESVNLNKINFIIKKIRIYYSLDVFFSLLSTSTFIIKKMIDPFLASIKKLVTQNNINNKSNSNDSSEFNKEFYNIKLDNHNIEIPIQKTESMNSISLSSKENILNNIKLIIESIQLELELPDNMKLFIYLKESSLCYINKVKYDVAKILFLLPSQINKKSNLLKVKNLSLIYNINKSNDSSMSDISGRLNARNNTDNEPLVLKVNSDSCVLSIPYLFDLSDVIDSIIHLIKAMKSVIYTVNGTVYINTPTIIEPDEIIKTLIICNMVSLQFIENDFESNLSKIYLYGTKEQKERVAREIAFEKKITDLRNIKNQSIKANIQNNNNNKETNSQSNETINENDEIHDQNSNDNNKSIKMNTNVSEKNTNSKENIITDIVNNNINANINENNNENNNESIDESEEVNYNTKIKNKNNNLEPETNTNSKLISTDSSFNTKYNNNNNAGITTSSTIAVAMNTICNTILSNENNTATKTSVTEDEDNIEAKILKASQLLKKINSNKWIKRVKEYKEENYYTSSPLMGSISMYNIKALIDKPNMLGKTSEEIIHMIDNQTPANKIYDTLVPIKLTLNIGSATMDLRDYPEKMFYLPESTDDPERPSLKFDVSVFITEQDPNEECKRWVEVKYFHGRRSEKVLRTINPVKMYYNAKCVIQTNQRAYFVWGYSIDPVFTHILQTISAFSKDCYDPSEKLAWWDKIRLNFHGSMDLVITQGCELDAHILGSFSPYYTLNSDYFGNDGINIVFSKGVNIKLGDTGVENEALRICCGELKCTIPRMGKEQYYEDYFNDDILNEIINNEIIFKLSGDVHISIICTFDPVIDNYFTEKRNHNELFLKLPEFATPYPNTMVI